MSTPDDLVLARVRPALAAFGRWGREQAAGRDPLALAEYLREHGKTDAASRVLFDAFTTNRSVDLRLFVERTRQDREDGLFERCRMKSQTLLGNPNLCVAGRIDLLNQLSWLERREGQDPWVGRRRGDPSPAAGRDCLDAAEAYLDQAEQAAGDDREAHRKGLAETGHQRAVIWMLRADALVRQGLAAEAERLLAVAEELNRQVLRDRQRTDGPDRLYVARTCIVTGGIARRRGDPEAALRAYRVALDIRAAAFDGDAHHDVADVLCYIADLREELGQFEQAEKGYRRAVAAFVLATPTELGRCVAARCHARLAQLLMKRGRPASVVREYAQQGLRRTGRLSALAPETERVLTQLAAMN